MKTKGFTLVELLVVIAILAILATVSVVGYTSYIENANKTVANDTLVKIRDYAISYDIAGEHGDKNGVINETEAKAAVKHVLGSETATGITYVETTTTTGEGESATTVITVTGVKFTKGNSTVTWTFANGKVE